MLSWIICSHKIIHSDLSSLLNQRTCCHSGISGEYIHHLVYSYKLLSLLFSNTICTVKLVQKLWKLLLIILRCFIISLCKIFVDFLNWSIHWIYSVFYHIKNCLWFHILNKIINHCINRFDYLYIFLCHIHVISSQYLYCFLVLISSLKSKLPNNIIRTFLYCLL